MKKIKSVKFYKNLYINFALVLILVFLPIVISLYINGQNFMSEINKYEYQTNLDIGYKTRVVFDTALNGINASMKKLMLEQEVIDFISTKTLSTEELDSIKAVPILKGALYSQEYVNNIQVYSKSTEILIDAKNGFVARNGNSHFWSAVFEWFNSAETYYAKTLNVIGENGILWKVEPFFINEEVSGYIVYEIDFKILAEWLTTEDETFIKKDFFIINDYGEILYYNGANNLYKNAVEALDCSYAILSVKSDSVSQTVMRDSNIMLCRVDSRNGDWIYAVAEHTDVSAKIMSKINKVTKITFFSIFIVCFLSVLLITAVTYIPVFRIVRVFTKDVDYKSENFHRKPNVILSETAYIINSMMSLLKNNRDMEKELEVRMAMLNNLQAKVLQIQTDPHFLYNSLDTIRWISIDEFGTNNNTSKMIENLSKFYRQYLSNDNTIVTVREEIEMIDVYMSIIKVRFDNRINFTTDIPEKFKGIQCLKMCLQPIIENAIKHGLRPLGYRGEINITLKEINSQALEFCVSDNGVGMTPHEIMEKNQELKKNDGNIDSRIGLSNVNKRIKLLYGDDYGVRIENGFNSRFVTSVYINFPIL